MKIRFGYYEGFTIRQWWMYFMKHKISNALYCVIYRFYIPKIITYKSPLAYRFKIISDSGLDYTEKYPTIRMYDNVSKIANIAKFQRIGKGITIVKNGYNEPIYEDIILPNSHLVFQ